MVNLIIMLETVHKVFIIESYFRNGERLANGEWSYSLHRCAEEFRERFPDVQIPYNELRHQINRSVDGFRETGSVGRKTGSGRPTKRTADNIEDLSHQENHYENLPNNLIYLMALAS